MWYTRSERLHLAAEPSFRQKMDFLQFMMERLFASSAPAEEEQGEDEEEDGDDMKAYQPSEYLRFHDMRRKDHAGKHPPVGQKKSGGGQIP